MGMTTVCFIRPEQPYYYAKHFAALIKLTQTLSNYCIFTCLACLKNCAFLEKAFCFSTGTVDAALPHIRHMPGAHEAFIGRADRANMFS